MRRHGFTLIELLVTSVLLFVLVPILLSGCGGSWKFEPKPVPGDEPAIRITKVKWYKTFGKIRQVYAYGRAYNVDFDDYTACLFIHVPGAYAGWWPKPTWAHPFTKLGSGGAWSNHLVTGGHDEDLDAVCAFLVRKNTYRPTGAYTNLPEVNPSIGIVARDIVWRPKEKMSIDENGVIHEWTEG